MTTYKFKKGEHFSFPRTSIIPQFGNRVLIEKVWRFNDSIQYTPDLNNSWSKLFGVFFIPPISFLIKNPSKFTRYNTAMIAFRWKNEALELSTYLHREGSKEYAETFGDLNPIVKVELNKDIVTSIEITDNMVYFNIDGTKFEFSFPKHSCIGKFIQPYFGGNDPSPKDINFELI